MDVKSLLESLKADLMCSICLGYLTDPVTVKCGHSFCRECLLQCKMGADATLICPECRGVTISNHLIPNKGLQNLSITGKIIISHLLQSVVGLTTCDQHGEKEKFFCEEDQRALCESCSLAPEHKEHRVLLLEKAASECKAKLQETLEILSHKKKDFLYELNYERMKEIQCKEDVEVLKQSVLSEYEKMYHFLWDEEKLQMRKLDQERIVNLIKFKKSKAELSQQIQALQQMALEIKKNLTKGPLEMLQDMKDILKRTEALLLPDPDCAFPNWLTCRITGLGEILMNFQRDLTLDPETADPHLILSEDLKSVKYDVSQDQKGKQKRFDYALTVLGAQRFTSGKHYWEVEVGDKTGWEVGLCKESVKGKRKFSNLPGDACTLLCFKSGNYFCHWTSCKVFHLKQPVHKVGIFLDYEKGHIAFYDAKDRSCIYSPPNIVFQEPLRPCFSPCLPNEEITPGSLTICPRSKQ